MELSTKGRYAVMALLDLAKFERESGLVSLNEIAARQTISVSYLEQLFAKMRRGGLVVAKRGPTGGYKLARAAAQISIASIVKAVEEEIKATGCDPATKAGCGGRETKCVAHDLWVALTGHIHEFMAKISLEDVLEGRLLTTAGE
ncbi:MAG: Rrf2 family transcriptional regulator iron-sulfur cluster assembly transcription factor [Hyphomonadaceae bacterium]|nr:MAG: Rrf2 family transcriptional regulator iron-sulfur cluster assembly transcription factor [Hyphomonadaceae bacterium]